MALPENIVARATADLQRALAKAEQSRASLVAAEAQAADLQAFLRTLERYATDPKAEVATEHGANRRQAAQTGSRGRELVDRCISVIHMIGGPVKIGDLLEAVLNAGFTVGGSDQKSNLAGYLSRDPRVVSRGRSIGWDVVETEGAALEPASEEAAPSIDTGGTDDSPTLTSRDLLSRRVFDD